METTAANNGQKKKLALKITRKMQTDKTGVRVRGAAFSFFPKRSGGCAPEAFVVAKQPTAALSVTRRKFRHTTCGALAVF